MQIIGVTYPPVNRSRVRRLAAKFRANALADEANVSKRAPPHTWRHSIATQLLDAGAPLHKVSSFLGHSDPKITVKAYCSESEGLKVEDFIDVE